MQRERSRAFGPFMMLLASVCFSLGGLLCKMIPWSAVAINGVRDLLGSLVIGGYLLATHHRLRVNGVVLAGAACMFGVTTLFVMANKMTTAANTIVLQYSAPVWIVLLMALFFRQKPKRGDLLAMAAVFLGIACFFIDSLSSGGAAGNVLAILAGICYAGLFILNSFEKGDALSSLFLGQLAAGLILTPFLARESNFSTVTLSSVIVLGLIQVGLGYIFFYQGTKYTHPVTASLVAGVEPILNPLLVAIFWNERLTPLAIIGAVIVVFAVLLYSVLKIRQEP